MTRRAARTFALGLAAWLAMACTERRENRAFPNEHEVAASHSDSHSGSPGMLRRHNTKSRGSRL